MADQGCGSGTVMREYRKGNWTVSETMVLIEAKQMDDERRMKRSCSVIGSESSEARSSKPAELRWKWVEDYCWKKGCFRSQNQCNDKWDNLMRDYKKVRDHERKLPPPSSSSDQHNNEVSYWKMEKNERKEKNLPSNMLPQIYEALVEVVDKKGAGQRVVAGVGSSSAAAAAATGGGGLLGGSNPNMGSVMAPITIFQSAAPMLHQLSAPIPVLQPVPVPLPPPSLQLQPPLPPPPSSQPNTSDSDTSEYPADWPTKRRRRGDPQQGTSTASPNNSQELGAAITKSASIIAEALNASEEREERRHRDLVSLHERRLQIEESKTEINRKGINGLVDAIDKLANSILALASSDKHQQSAPK